ncbi:ATP-dependent RNA helicase/nuclease Hef [Natronomonas moolapensis 8.8.11]|uniref:ATP-dependent RNA helicase/nuclease Hef n=1 Tax=Natronomonas moolapensis (strain DSM 18674 / CECT 7526 / JCM 14361 / 8.8.11) TaxID=268739 RepID=M1XKB3_NATM8|nr:DEAD/DEAH box helicase [Natronomonas moolapensis]CCQ35585.1 ATP-dependent RNA helicase/nuclease Hef [Natronomonas moolapensis 8.8.11]
MATASGETEYIEGPLLADGLLERRNYQLSLAETAASDHTLVCLPTGLGKTAVSLLVTAERLAEHGGTSLLLAPTKPLVQQHAAFYREALSVDDDDIVVFTGAVRPDDRAALWESTRVVCATPQVIENDLVGNRISLSDVTHLTVDECHRATGNYAYNYIADRYHADAETPLVTGMSASPGGDKEEILTVCDNLGLCDVAVMTEDDADVAAHTHDTDVEWERIELPDTVIEIRDALNDVISERLHKLKGLGVTNSTDPSMSQSQLNAIRAKLQELINNDSSEGYKGMSAHAEIMKLRRAVELVETQSVESLRRYFERQREDAKSSGASKASQRFVSDPRVKEAMRRAEAFDDLHPKFRRARILLAQTLGIEDGERVIVFTESRDTAETLTAFLGEHFSTRRFVGQGDKEGSDGMTQTEQKDTLDAFRNGEFEVLVSTSVAEEGLDVPDVDLVLFYEPVPKGIRSIQRKGRTGRASDGRVVVLLAEDTRDEAFFWISRNEEKRMEKELRKLKDLEGEIESEIRTQVGIDEFDAPDGAGAAAGRNGSGDAGAAADPDETGPTGTDTETDARDQAGLADFAGTAPDATPDDRTPSNGAGPAPDGPDSGPDAPESAVAEPAAEGVEVVADQRELDAHIARDLSTREGIETRLETLEVGDYVLSDRVVVERKAVEDFLETLVGGDRSLFEQVGAAARHYARPVVIIEGERLYEARNVHPNAIRGAIASLAVDFGASVLRTTDADDTADLLEVIARREQETDDRSVSVHGEKGGKTLAEQQEYVVGAVAEVGPVTARALLAHFGSVEAVMGATEEELLAVDGVGEVTADRIRTVTASPYPEG